MNERDNNEEFSTSDLAALIEQRPLPKPSTASRLMMIERAREHLIERTVGCSGHRPHRARRRLTRTIALATAACLVLSLGAWQAVLMVQPEADVASNPSASTMTRTENESGTSTDDLADVDERLASV